MVNPQILRMFGKSTVDQLNTKYSDKLKSQKSHNFQSEYQYEDEIPYDLLSQYPTREQKMQAAKAYKAALTI